MRTARPFMVLLVALKGLLVATTFLPAAIVGVFVDEVIVGGNGERLYVLLGALVAVYVVETFLKVIEIWAGIGQFTGPSSGSGCASFGPCNGSPGRS